MVETFYDLEELVDAIEAVRSVSSLPIVALMTFDEDAETLAGVTARPRRPSAWPSSGSPRSARTTAPVPDRARRRSQAMATGGRSPRCRTSASRAWPAVGSSTRTRRRSTSPSSPPTRANLGAKVIGGCCGTTPTEIAAIRRRVEEEREPRAPLEFFERELAVALERERARDALRRRLREGEFVISVQLDPPLGAIYDGLLEIAHELREAGMAPSWTSTTTPRPAPA